MTFAKTPVGSGLILVAVAACCCAAVDGAELRLKAQGRASSGIVTLGDVAEVFAADEFQAQQFRSIELGPAPAPGSRRFIRLREVQDALWARGFNLAEHRFTGVEQIELIGPGEPVTAVKRTFRATEAQYERAARTASDLILRRLRKQAGERQPFQVVCDPTDEQVEVLLTYGARLQVEGGAAPWTGRQSFSFLNDDVPGLRFELEADVTLPPGVVTIVKPLSQGAIIHESDVELRPAAALNSSIRPFHSLADVVGHETTWSIPAGTILTAQSIRKPLLVKRGDAVTLYARSAGLSVRTTVRAREDGSQGDLITVESTSSREPFYARVTGVQQAEVFAAPAEAAPPRAAMSDSRFNP